MTAVREACWSDHALSDSLEPGAEMPAHVRVCVSCRVRREGLARGARLLRDAPPAPPSEAARAAVRDAVLRAAEAPRARPAWSRPAVAAAAAVLLALGATAGFWAARPADEAQLEPLGAAQFTRQRTRVGASGVEDEVVTLTEGRLRVAVGDLEPERRFRVVAVDAELELRGAAVEVEVAERRLWAVRVLSGVVGVRRVGQPMVWLSAGEGWRSGEREAAGAAEREAAGVRERPTPRAIEPEAAGTIGRETARAPDRAVDRAPPSGFDRAAPRRFDRAAPRRTAAAPTPEAAASTPEAAAPTPEAAAPTPEAAARAPASPLAPAPPAPPPDATASAPARAAPHASIAPSPLPAPAAQWARTPTTAPLDLTPPVDAPAPPPRALAPPTDRAALEEAAEQQFRWGWERLRVHDRVRAARHFAAAAELIGDGPLAEDARYWHARALVEADDDAADEACRDFLRRHPDSSRWDELSLLLAERLTSRAPDEARALLRRVAALGRSDRAAKARAALRAMDE